MFFPLSFYKLSVIGLKLFAQGKILPLIFWVMLGEAEQGLLQESVHVSDPDPFYLHGHRESEAKSSCISVHSFEKDAHACAFSGSSLSHVDRRG